jgi:eukaryotic-like serine/threonine-protein kinase
MKDSKENVKFTYFKTIGRIALIFFLGFSVFLVISTIMLIFLTKPAKEVRIPDVEGKRFVDVYNSLMRQGVRPHVRFQDVYDVEDGLILHQFPEKGRIVPEHSTFKLLVSRNRYILEMPNLIGADLPKAINRLKSLHYLDKKVALSTGVVSYVQSSKTPANIIIAQDPKGGEKITPSKKVNLLVSSGSKDTNTTVPNVTGQSIELCFDLLQAKGLVVSQEVVATDDIQKSGTVVSQNPAAGSPINRGDPITLQVQWYALTEHPYYAYEKIEYKIPSDEHEGLYEAYIEDGSPKRVRFSRRMRPGQNMVFMFHRSGNARINIVCNKDSIDVMNLDAEDY